MNFLFVNETSWPRQANGVSCRLVVWSRRKVCQLRCALFARLTIAGEGPFLSQLQNLARDLNISNCVSFRGFVSQEQLREIYYASHIFLHPSQTGHDGNQEGIPNSMLEAMASGLPAFATQHGGIPEVIETEMSGVLLPEGDHEKLAAALLDAAKDPGFLSRIARNGAEIVRKNFDLCAQAQRLDEIYLQPTDTVLLIDAAGLGDLCEIEVVP
ncbi:MAG: hypothetical protein DME65_02460 [Verrucomicrobia bacterium]|nr:MAG: hypothetical protein DME65_02460 [Verrucomicrobiota bacterium]